MTREEALKVASEMHGWLKTDWEKEALETLIPELKESEDERIIKTLQEYVKTRNWNLGGPTQDEVLAWLERQKEKTVEIDEIIRKARSEGRQEVIDNPEYYQLIKPEEMQEPECDNETDVQKAYREGMNAGRKEVFDHPEYYGLQLRRMYDYETGERNPEWSEEDEKVRKWLLEYFYLHRDDLRGASVTSMEVLSFLDKHSGKGEEDIEEFEFDPKPGEKFWVRCKTNKTENLWFDKDDERPAYAVNANGIITYIVHIKKDGTGNCVSYQNKEKFLETFEIIENLDELEFDPQPGEKFWVRCKTEKSENHWFDKDDERPAYAARGKKGTTYLVCFDKDGEKNSPGLWYLDQERLFHDFDILESKR